MKRIMNITLTIFLLVFSFYYTNKVSNYLKDKDVKWYDIPSNVVGVIVDPISGNLATEESPHKKILYYIKGTEPNYTNQVFAEYNEPNINVEKKD